MKKILFFLLIFFFYTSTYAGYRYESDQYRATVFFNPHDKTGVDVTIKGKILSLSTSEELQKNDMIGGVQPNTKVTVRVFSNQDVKVNDELLVINDKNLVVSRFRVRHVMDAKSFGTMAIGYGNLILSRSGFRVVKKVESLDEGAAYLYISRGRYHLQKGDKGRAIENFKKAIELEKRNPSAHMNLGMVYYTDGIYNFAYSELKHAYDDLNNLYDNQDKFLVLKTLAEIRFIETYDQYNIMKNKVAFRKEGIDFCKKALKIDEQSTDMLYLLSEYYYRDFSRKDDNLARETLLKLLKQNESHSKGALLLARLYIKHGNKEKGLLYARQALKYSPNMPEAEEIIKRNE